MSFDDGYADIYPLGMYALPLQPSQVGPLGLTRDDLIERTEKHYTLYRSDYHVVAREKLVYLEHFFDLPQAFVRDEAQRMADEMRRNLTQQGLNAADIELNADMFTAQAAGRVALGLLLPVLVEEYKLQATDEQVKAVISEAAESYEDPQEVIDWYFADRSRLAGATNLAVEANVVDFVLGKAKVTEKKLGFDEVMGAAAA